MNSVITGDITGNFPRHFFRPKRLHPMYPADSFDSAKEITEHIIVKKQAFRIILYQKFP